jgi:hypothetical protein
LAKLAAAGFDFRAGLEVEFHLFKLENPRLAPEDATWPPRAPEVSLLNQGYQYLTESRFDQLDAALAPIWRGVVALDMPLRSLEVELGPSQCEFTFRPQTGLAAADTMVLFRAAAKQIARRHGLFASFMCRPALPNLFSSGWHLQQSLLERGRKVNAFAGGERDGPSATGLYFLGGVLAHAHASAAHHADRQRLQALPALYARARSRDLQPRQSRRDGARTGALAIRRPGWRTASASPRPILSLHRRADPRRPRRHRAAPRSAHRPTRPTSQALALRKISAKRSPRCAPTRLSKDCGQAFIDYTRASRSLSPRLHRRGRRRSGGRRHRLGAELIFRFVLIAPSLVGRVGEGS